MIRRTLQTLLPVVALAGVLLAEPVEARQTTGLDPALTEMAGEVASAWAAGDTERLGPWLRADGIRLQLEGPARENLAPRHVLAAFREVLRDHEDGATEVTRVAPVAGSSNRGLVEFVWTARVKGTSHAVEHSYFAGVVRTEDGWRIDEFRRVPRR
ncbi:MAG: hypothetical protein EA352_12825 [Gemmatimonadales bacterium]|nr:MAG: hypothetical protein EA352_12825 [Gemmatimonadales bacterium]